MTYNEFLDSMKKKNFIIYKCNKCEWRGIGAATFYHEMHSKDHTTYNEDKPQNKN